jgi:hypothetical protein
VRPIDVRPLMVCNWPEAKLERCDHVGLAIYRQKRDLPALILHVTRKAKAVSCKDIGIDGHVILSPTSWKK